MYRTLTISMRYIAFLGKFFEGGGEIWEIGAARLVTDACLFYLFRFPFNFQDSPCGGREENAGGEAFVEEFSS